MSSTPNPGLTDLVSDTTFREWVFTGGFRQPDTSWSRWVAEHPEQKELVRQGIDLLLATHVKEEGADDDLDELVAGTWDRINQREQPVNPFRRWWWAAAASVALVLAGWWLIPKNRVNDAGGFADKAVSQTVAPSWLERANTTRRPQLLTLSDSSSVVLMPGSSLRYPARFAPDSREVHLIGAAFFEVTKRPRHPFLVQTPSLTTRVVGTSFSIQAYAANPVAKVVVKTGQVAVYPKNGSAKKPVANPIMLLPDQQVTYNQQKDQIERPAPGSVLQPDLQAFQKASFEFYDAPVTMVLDSIAHVYGLEIKYEAQKLEKCILTTSLTDVPLPGKLKIICKALNDQMRYELSDRRILINGPGCD